MTQECDLLIIGGGPAGLSAAINAASEGLRVCLMDDGLSLGGQARESNAIENYPGFPEGVTGASLMANCVRQAEKFRTDMFAPQQAGKLVKTLDGRYMVLTSDYQDFLARAVVLSLGLTYRRHPAAGVSSLMGRGVYYGMPSGMPIPNGSKVFVVGGANSAGQAVCRLSKNPKIEVKMLIRRRIEDGMSAYLVDRIRAAPNVEVVEDAEVTEVIGRGGSLREIAVQRGNMTWTYPASHMFIFIGAAPRTMWLDGVVEMDCKKFVKTGGPLAFQTSLPGVFAAGDVRAGSIKRISAGVGEGSAVVQSVHQYLSMSPEEIQAMSRVA